MTTETLPELLPDTGVPSEEVVREGDTDKKTALLPLYKVIMWDDNVTTMEFVIRMLIKVFSKDYHTAEKLMLEVHLSGASHVDTLPLERAEFKVQQVHTAASLENYPFRCSIEPL
ncbi:MAG: ATP-dependent Clp protease adaptor ClpS [Nitrospinaceae bacterium]|nr:ATP-dependent Clp protease adaptor ClpS [Nitrospinaceae bacterium]NIR57062.1 ATP-dependent Clp protease adaptor ClpS [Nitrospinaceae bacterium]NIT84373.1 ATP-dependent Clp protease adaptor ClpS [Nitrospinaceae bacterium]NIU46560.1 ATP-dependent Clp protease adaptor ClpS [Nitrospinaceae bacterium]NIU98752.1 ATP-dependent Clp protease adaptor ClpS [Nitrospinaceae bacterium]